MTTFNADGLIPDRNPDWLTVRKKPVVVHALQMHIPFEVTTREDKLAGKAGDYLIVGVRGEKYPIDKSIFEETYDIVTTAPDG